jgi:hypothetical protein
MILHHPVLERPKDPEVFSTVTGLHRTSALAYNTSDA